MFLKTMVIPHKKIIVMQYMRTEIRCPPGHRAASARPARAAARPQPEIHRVDPAKDPGLAKWVSNQRWCKRKLDHGEPSHGMTAELAARLTALSLGLVWNLEINGFGQQDSISSETQAASVGGQ
jgi:hypothetical protein